MRSPLPTSWLPAPWFLAIACVVGLGIAACSGGTSEGGTGASTPAAASPPEVRAARLSVFAAQSLAESFQSIARAFEAQHPGVTAEVNLASSSALATQIEQGAPADVFASADVPQMERLAKSGLLAAPAATFAVNAPVVIVPVDNRASIERVSDLGRPGLKLVLYPPDVPIGNYSRQVLANLSRETGDSTYATRVLANLVSLEPTVRAALTKVELGEADATIVYRTDARTSRGVKAIEIPASANVIADYPIAVVAASKQRALAEAFVAFVRGPDGQRILQDAGFEAAP